MCDLARAVTRRWPWKLATNASGPALAVARTTHRVDRASGMTLKSRRTRLLPGRADVAPWIENRSALSIARQAPAPAATRSGRTVRAGAPTCGSSPRRPCSATSSLRRLELNEAIARILARFEVWQADEVPLSVTLLACGLAWYAWRRRREVQAQLALHERAERRIAELLARNRELSQPAHLAAGERSPGAGARAARRARPDLHRDPDRDRVPARLPGRRSRRHPRRRRARRQRGARLVRVGARDAAPAAAGEPRFARPRSRVAGAVRSVGGANRRRLRFQVEGIARATWATASTSRSIASPRRP